MCGDLNWYVLRFRSPAQFNNLYTRGLFVIPWRLRAFWLFVFVTYIILDNLAFC
jgi:hypothetical protein